MTSPPYTFEACRDGVFVNNLVVLRPQRALDLRQHRPEHRARDLHLREQPLVRLRQPGPVGADPAGDRDRRHLRS